MCNKIELQPLNQPVSVSIRSKSDDFHFLSDRHCKLCIIHYCKFQKLAMMMLILNEHVLKVFKYECISEKCSTYNYNLWDDTIKHNLYSQYWILRFKYAQIEFKMECVIGIVGKDFVLLAADTNQAHSIVVMKQDEDKMIKLGSHSAMLVTGDPGDKVQFGEYIQRNLQLYKMVNGFELSTGASANYTRRELATSLRSRVSAVYGIRLCCSPNITDIFGR